MQVKSTAKLKLQIDDQYAIKAFKFSALDYLLKPVDNDELQAVAKKAVA